MSDDWLEGIDTILDEESLPGELEIDEAIELADVAELAEFGAPVAIPVAFYEEMQEGVYAHSLGPPESKRRKYTGEMTDKAIVTPKGKGPDAMEVGEDTVAHMKTNARLGNNPGLGGILKSVHTGVFDLNSETLYSYPCIRIPHNVDITRRNTRSWNLVDVKGINWKMFMEPSTNWDNEDVYLLRWFFIGNQDARTATESWSNIPNEEFWHEPYPATANGNGLDFDQNHTMLIKKHYNVNKRKYNVLKSGYKYMTSANYTYNPLNQNFMIDEYIPLHRQIEFEDETKNFPEDYNVYFTFFVTKLNKRVTDVAVEAIIKGLFQTVTYHRTPNNYLL